MSLCMHESFRYCQNIYPSWLGFECGHNHPVCSSSPVQYLRTTEQEGTMGRGIQDMNNMNRWTVWALWAGRSVQLSPSHLTFPCTPLPTLCSNRVRTILLRSQYFCHFLTGASRPFDWVKYVCVMEDVMCARVLLNTLPRDKKCCPHLLQSTDIIQVPGHHICLMAAEWGWGDVSVTLRCHMSHLSRVHTRSDFL